MVAHGRFRADTDLRDIRRVRKCGRGGRRRGGAGRCQLQAPTDTTPAGSTRPSWILSPADAARGSALYSVNCAACHQPTGRGLAGVFPPLANDPIVQSPDPTEHIRTVLNGTRGSVIGGVSYASPMPAFKDILNDDDVAAIINHERTSWGNAAPTVSASASREAARLIGGLRPRAHGRKPLTETDWCGPGPRARRHDRSGPPLP